MALSVEDGTGIVGADSYLDLSDARALAASFGLVLPDDDTQAEVALRNGAAYVDMFEGKFSGTRKVDDQGLSWPRDNAYKCYGSQTISIADDVVPSEMMKAQVYAASEYGAGSNPRPSDDGREIQEETVGPITQKYFETGASGGGFVITGAIDAMRPLNCNSYGAYTQRTVRA